MEVCRAAVGTDCRASESRPSLLSSPHHPSPFSSFRSIAPAAPAASRSIASAADATSFSSSVVEDLSSSRFLSSCLPREEEDRRNKSGFPPSFSSVSIVFIVPWISTPPSSGNRRYRCTSNTNAHMYGPRRIVPAPFFERDSSPISFRSPVIN